MPTMREVNDVTVAALNAEFAVEIEAGEFVPEGLKFNEEPHSVPFLRWCILPSSSELYENGWSKFTGEVTIFCGVTSEDINEARLTAIEMAERAGEAWRRTTGLGGKIEFTAEHSDFCVAAFLATFPYESSAI